MIKKFIRAAMHKQKRGVVIIWAALLMLALIGFIGMGIDMGLVTLVANQMQVGADAAALAGARMVRADIERAQQDAQAVAEANRAARQAIHLALNPDNAASGDIVVGNYDRETQTFTPQLTNRNAVQVVVRRKTGTTDGPVPLAFGPIFGVNEVSLERRAIAIIGGGTGQGMIALSPDKPNGLYVYGSAQVSVANGGIQVNSNSSGDAVDLQGSKFIVDAPVLNIVGGYNAGGGTINSVVNTGAPYKPDPLAYIPEPTWDPVADLRVPDYSSGVLQPGYYPDGIQISTGNFTFQPGIYILGTSKPSTPAFGLNGGSVSGEGVMFFIDNGAVSINGNGAMALSPPKPTRDTFARADIYENILFFQARDNTSEALILGTAGVDMSLSGTIYFPSARTELGGTCQNLGSQFIADTITIRGNADLTIKYDGKMVAPGNHVFLVR